ncbi:MAG: isochorismatase family protein [Cyanobacteria bacterium SZAS LIN-2]|nr:isochorismatase family protein [Cyanobacteria bacterium SZAS LIN-3]MBS1997453.1 isochorismatase family protein [Cyanobacteria bacterium SZAS LIN-2]
MKLMDRATVGGAALSHRALRRTEYWHDLSSSVASSHEVIGGDTTLVVVDMQQRFLNNWEGPSTPPVDEVIRQVKHAMKMGWGIVLLEMKPWRLGETISPIVELLEGKYDRFVRRSKQTPSGSKELLEACYENGFGMGLFRITGVFLDACVLETALGVLEAEPASLVRMMEEACSTDIDVRGAWAWVLQRARENPRLAVSSERIDSLVDGEG